MNNKLRTTILGGLVSASLAAPAVAGDFSNNSIVGGNTADHSIPAGDASGNKTFLDVLAPSGGDNFSFSTGYHTQYIFRGIDFGDNLVDWSLESSFNLGGIDLTAGVWAANVFDEPGGSEVDFYVSTSKDLGFANLELGYILFFFPDAQGASTQEFYLGLSKEVGPGIGLAATYYYDFDQFDGAYVEFSAEKSFDIVDAGLAVGWNPDEGADFTHIQATISKTFKINTEVALTPYVSYSFALTENDGFGNVRNDEFIAGVSLGFDF